jgi:acetyltransferase-like isoleucine patch superfamily enzyme
VLFDGLTIEDKGSHNIIEIDEKSNFKRSKIMINGNNNKIILGKTLSYTNLIINFRGNNKVFKIEPSKKNINGLKFVSIRGENQRFIIGSNFSCGGLEVQMNDGNESFSIGDDCLFSWGIKVRTSDGHSVVDLNSNKAINLPKDVSIGDRVWVSEDVSFLKGSKILQDCVVGSRAVVTKEFTQPNCVIAGFPATIVKENIKWDRRKPSEYNNSIVGN